MSFIGWVSVNHLTSAGVFAVRSILRIIKSVFLTAGWLRFPFSRLFFFHFFVDEIIADFFYFFPISISTCFPFFFVL